MWLQYFIAIAVELCLLIAPGYLFLRGLGANRSWAFCGAAALSIFFYVLMTTVLPLLGITCSWQNVFLPVLALCLIAFVAKNFIRQPQNRSKNIKGLQFLGPAWLPALYLVIGFMVGTVYFTLPLDSPLSFIQEFDNSEHLSFLQAFTQSGDWSTLHPSRYLGETNLLANPLQSGGGFYPAAWHIVGVLTISLLDIPTTMAANVTNFVFAFLIFPIAMLLLLDKTFEGSTRHLVLGAIACPGFAIFPIGLIIWGPLFPNMASYAVFPIALTLAMNCIDALFKKRILFAELISFILTFLALIVLQPNAFFFGFICISIYTAFYAFDYRKEDYSLNRRIVNFALVTLAAITIWTALFYAPFLQKLQTENWGAFLTAPQAIKRILLLEFNPYPAQVALAIAAFVGIASLKTMPEIRWAFLAAVIFGVMYFYDVSQEGFLKHYLTGFWYTDSTRIAACMAITVIPLGAAGLATISTWVEHFFKKIEHPQTAAILLTLVVFALLNYAPNVQISESFSIRTPYGVAQERLASLNTKGTRNVYDQDEIDFVEKVKEEIPEHALVLNVPEDGSLWAYGINGLNVYYRDFRVYKNDPSYAEGFSKERDESVYVRENIDKVGSDETLQNILEEMDCHYVLLLDEGDSLSEQPKIFTYKEDLWDKFQILNDKTPGLELVLEDGDMRLYRIVY